MPRVVIAQRNVTGVSGATRIVLAHARAFAQRGAHVVVVAERADRRALHEAGAILHRVRRLPFGRRGRRARFARVLEDYVARTSPDLVCGHGDARHQDVLYVHNMHHLAHEAIHGRPLAETAVLGAMQATQLREQHFRLCIANSCLMREDFVRRFGVPEERIAVVYPGYDPAQFNPQRVAALREDARHRLGLSPERLAFGLVTSGDLHKRGADRVLGALARVPAALRERMELVVVGSARAREPHQRLLQELGLSDRVRLLPPAADVARFYAALDVFVLPARIEEFGMAALEAMACGLPAVLSTMMGVCELLPTDGRELVLADAEPPALAHLLERLVEDPALRERGREASLAAAAAGNTWERHVAHYLAALEEHGLWPPAGATV